jgi:hypothetical protein
MKIIKLSIMALLVISVVACQKSNDLTGNVTNEEAADMVAGSISYSSNGVGNISDDASFTASSPTSKHLTCGSTVADTVSRSSTVLPYTYAYKLIYSYTLTCNTSNAPDNLKGSMAYSGFFNGPNISSTNTGSATFVVAGLSPTALNYVINGEYKSTGTFKSKIDTTNTGTSNIDVVITNLTLTKPARVIKSGTTTVTISGNVPKKGNFNFIGSLVFNGDGTATLTLATSVYTINLATGARTKVK